MNRKNNNPQKIIGLTPKTVEYSKSIDSTQSKNFCPPVISDASKYNGGPLDKKSFDFLIGIDWLSLNIHGRLPFKPETKEYKYGDFGFINSGKSSRHFQSIFQIYYTGFLFGSLEIFPRPNSVLKEESMILKIDNQNFYFDIGLLGILQDFSVLFALNIQNISRIDIFMDSYGFSNGMTLNHLDYLINEGKVISNTKTDKKASHSEKQDGRFIKSGFSWGSRSSGRFLRVYNKSRELDKGNKDYIQEWHDKNGLCKHDVYRFEYCLKNAWLKRIEDFLWFKVFDYDYLVKVLQAAVKGHFSFVWEDGKSRNDRKEPVNLFDWDHVFNSIKTPLAVLTRPRAIGVTLQSIKLKIRSDFREYVLQGQMPHFMNSIQYILWSYGHDAKFKKLKQWWEEKKPHYLNEFLKIRAQLYPFDENKMAEHEEQGLKNIINSLNDPKSSAGFQLGLFD